MCRVGGSDDEHVLIVARAEGVRPLHHCHHHYRRRHDQNRRYRIPQQDRVNQRGHRPDPQQIRGLRWRLQMRPHQAGL